MKTLGDCQGLWEEFITRCSDSGNLYGIEHTELEESISQRGLNVNATEFVPGAFTNTSHSTAEEQKSNRKSRGLENTPCSKSPLFQQDLQKDHTLLSVGQRNFDDSDTRALNDHANLEDSEPETTSDSDDAGDEFSESDELGNADDFAEYDNVDETVPPKHMDDIILALKAKCEENEKKRKHRDETMREKDDMGQYFAPDDASESKEIPVSNPFRLDVARKNVVHEDYKMTTRKGKTRIFLVNMKIGYSERTERLLRQPKLKEQEYLQPEYLEQLLQKEPELYRQCSLRISYDGSRTSYGEIQDVATEDILIEGNTRQCFDGDSVVVKLTNEPSGEGAAPQTTKEGMKGEIVGVKNRMINQRGRQFVCTISRENPWVMYPINRSMTPIGNLRDESCKGVPIYSKIQAESAEKAVLVETLSLKEALSGKYLFVVQYLQWKRTFPYPLGIVTKKIRRGYGLPEAIKPLDAEYQLKGSFPYDVEKEVERQINACSRITRCERESRQDVKRAFTIDPPGSRALDDALTTEKLENNLHRVGVHIADVSYFVQPGSRLDAEAQKRGHRFGDVLMLPEYLSFDVCSLLPNQERLAVSVYMVLDQDGNVQREEELDFCRTIVKSQCQLTYAEAQQVILGNSIRNRPHNNGNVTPEIEQSIRTLSSLAQKRRKIRLSDESYYHFQHADRKEDLEAHELVEEMMILANTSVAKYLAQRKAELLPLRVQLPPKTDKLNEWRESFGDCAKLSLSLRRHLLKDPVCTELFVVPASTWNDITRALRRRDKRELTHLIGNDNIYPQLCVARSLLNGLQRRAEDVRAADVPVNNRVHWSLNVLEYTRFTSPIRRYLDIEVHRLLLDSERQGVDFEDIPDLHRRCSLLSERSSMFETDCARIQFAVDLKDTACEIDAVVESIALDFIQLQFLRDANQYLSPSQRRVRISHLGPAEQPGVDESLTRVELNWTLRIYNASPENMKRARRSRNQERHLREDRIKIESLLPTTLNYSRLSHHIPGSLWLEVLDAVKEENFNRLKECLEDLRSRISRERERLAGDQLHEIMVEGTFNVEEQLEQPVQQEDDDAGNDEDDDSDENDGDSYDDDEDDDEDEKEDKDDDDEVLETNSEVTKDEENKLHFFDTTLVLRISDIVSVQLSTNETDAFISPDIQLFKLAPGINICVEHRKLADKCFAEVASEKASKQRYDSVIKYVKAWKPLLTMEAASNAVSNDDAVLLQNVEMKWKENDDRELVGEFKLDKNFCETRQIEILHGDYACVRVSCPTIFSTSSSNSGSFSTMESKLSHRDEYKEYSRSDNEGEADKNSLSGGGKRKEWYWVGHCIFTGADSIVTAVDKSLKFTLRLFQHSVNIPQGLQEGRICSCIVEIIKKTIPSR